MNHLFPSLLLLAAALPLSAAPPAVGEKAPDFNLSTSEGRSIRLSEATAHGDVVLIVLRGYPGYQCPYCSRQVRDFIVNSAGFAKAAAHVVLVYPGPPQTVEAKAHDFLADKKLPDNFDLVLDPGYEFTNQYGLRWNAPHETAYPSTFLIDRNGVVFFTKISKAHGDRSKAADVLGELAKHKPVQ